jgi:5-methylthioribose kinase
MYLSEGAVLLHGDYYPGSWMRSEGNLFVIDPEFSFLGFAEFDLGVMAAHLILATDQKDLPLQLSHNYGDRIDSVLVGKIAGMEIIRRLLGLAQLPLSYSLDKKEELLTLGMELCLAQKPQ